VHLKSFSELDALRWPAPGFSAALSGKICQPTTLAKGSGPKGISTGDFSEALAAIGYPESAQSWGELLQQFKRLGLSSAPKLAIGDSSLGFWIALQEESH
jgi:hypothetical protein